MDEHINNGNTTTLMKNTKECALKWKNAVPKGVQENTGVL